MSIVVDPEDMQTQTDLEASNNEDQVNDLEKEITENVPDKFKGKSVTDVATAYTELEKRFGQQGNELGELRKLTDDILQRQLDIKDKENEITDDDFYEDPKKSVNQLVDNHPSLKRLDALEKNLAEQDFTARHPKWREHAVDTNFTTWIQSSRMRTNLYNRANAFDYSSANDLFDMWDEYTSLISDATNAEKEIQKDKKNKALKDATSESTSTDGASKKVLRRSDLIRMKMYEPEEYASRQDEILKAYAEGRVK